METNLIRLYDSTPPFRGSRKRSAPVDTKIPVWREIKLVKPEPSTQFLEGHSLSDAIFSEFKPFDLEELDIFAMHTEFDQYNWINGSCSPNSPSPVSADLQTSSDQSSEDEKSPPAVDISSDPLKFEAEEQSSSTAGNIIPTLPPYTKENEETAEEEPAKEEAPPARFQLRQQPYSLQRKSYASESRYISPNPIVIVNPKHDGEEIVSCSVTASLVCDDGSRTVKGLMETAPSEGFTHDLDLDTQSTPKFMLKILQNSSGDEFRLKFVIHYETDDGEEHDEIVISDPFAVRSNEDIRGGHNSIVPSTEAAMDNNPNKEEDIDAKDHHGDASPPHSISPESLAESNEERNAILSDSTNKYHEQLKGMIVPNSAVTPIIIQDKEGKDVSSWKIDPSKIPAEVHPLCVFINRKSGGQQGVTLLELFRKLFHPCQVHDLADGGPKDGLQMFQHVPRARILVAGGDGTAGWVLSAIDDLNIDNAAPVAVLPLGTGNDLARSIGWGPGYEGQKIVPILKRVEASVPIKLDRWSLKIAPSKPEGGYEELKQVNVMNNYFSIGIDASIALEFHRRRTANPEKFNSRLYNKFSYATIGGNKMFHSAVLKGVTLVVDEKEIIIPEKSEGLCIINLPSYMGGADMWGRKKSKRFQPPTYSDGLMEVISVTGSFHLGAIKSHLSGGKRLAQGKHVQLRLTVGEVPTQIDGEPWMQGPCTVDLSLLNQGHLLLKQKRK
ncbi:diacylglycerol kinase theta-like [Planoprotostelium fungivorum]|uniref:Diacylglycerol kinase n=1 Tax=Planoprotostelium fungivorum TaxID=1890364 RepID=A0A2P6NWL8_9EUKA|nr:diacylglycerol kinase theta-like [Planoprotostelium fungivorum]